MAFGRGRDGRCCTANRLIILGFGMLVIALVLGFLAMLGLPSLLGNQAVVNAEKFSALPKRQVTGTVVGKGVQYMGDCGTMTRTYIHGDVPFSGCVVSGTGAQCLARQDGIKDVAIDGAPEPGQPIARRLSYAMRAAMSQSDCTDYYKFWLKVNVPGVGERCAFRFGIHSAPSVGIESLGTVTRMYNHVAPEVTLWTLVSDPDDCILGWQDLSHLVDEVKVTLSSYNTVLAAASLSLIAFAFVSFGIAMCEKKEICTADQVCFPEE